MLQKVYHPGGEMVAYNSYSFPNGETMCSVADSIPDAAEHSADKEAIRLLSIKFKLPGLMLREAFANLSETTALEVGWRPGSFGVGGFTSLDWELFDILQVFVCQQSGTLAGSAVHLPNGILMDFRNAKVISDPRVITFGVGLRAVGTVGPISACVFGVDLTYEWVKATAQDIQGYLSWEALGPQYV